MQVTAKNETFLRVYPAGCRKRWRRLKPRYAATPAWRKGTATWEWRWRGWEGSPRRIAQFEAALEIRPDYEQARAVLERLGEAQRRGALRQE